MKQYRKKPVTIEAVQFDGLNPTEIKDFVGENCEVEIYDNEVTPPVARIVIHTLEGDMEVSRGDYVIKGVKGEFYPCKPDIFQQTYESAETQKELEEEMEEFFETMPVLEHENIFDVTFQKIARHFAEWGAEHLRDSTKMIDKSLEEAAEEYTQKMLESWRFDSTGCRPLREPFIAGAEWQKEQMMKDAYVESKIVEDGRIELEGDPLPCLNPIILLPYPQFQPGDKVRIIIVKEDSHE